jgi:hypothetical protein
LISFSWPLVYCGSAASSVAISRTLIQFDVFAFYNHHEDAPHSLFSEGNMAKGKSASAFAAGITAQSTVVAGKRIKNTDIVSRVMSALRLQPPINPGMKLSKVPGGGTVNNWDMALILMAYPPFARDGLELQKSRVMNFTTLGELGDEVFGWYDANGWTISS